MPSERSQEDTWRRERASSETNPAVPRPTSHDRRKHLRFPVDECTLTLYRSGLMNTIGIRRDNLGKAVLDLSEGGLRARVSEKLEIGARVKIRLEMAKYSDEIEAGGEVRWCAANPTRPDIITAGIMFVKIDPMHSRKIANMKNWFTSPHFRQKRDQKEKDKKKDLFDLLS
jgi:Tfp pilus assembly protein PilZ